MAEIHATGIIQDAEDTHVPSASRMIPVPNRKLTLMCRALGADTTQARGLSSKWKAF